PYQIISTSLQKEDQSQIVLSLIPIILSLIYCWVQGIHLEKYGNQESLGLIPWIRSKASNTKIFSLITGGTKQWKMLSYLVALPAVALCMVNAFMSGEHGRPEFIAYEHLRLRTKRFPWGEGQKSLFHNSHANALPDGYEEEEH
ncbi:cytochrome c oxidase subunit 6A, mitochondrial-like, partial [Penaeus indicus]|uniref:cytochrome c oxidase subunit 6A, mitochondrial-like n=1 Tax=Penaeus indicus TaxID=29960 RepID=UPI00300C524A